MTPLEASLAHARQPTAGRGVAGLESSLRTVIQSLQGTIVILRRTSVVILDDNGITERDKLTGG